MFVSSHDNRLGLKEKIVGLDGGSTGAVQYKAYKLQQIESLKVINDEINGQLHYFHYILPWQGHMTEWW
jgi:hypothetical protein